MHFKHCLLKDSEYKVDTMMALQQQFSIHLNGLFENSNVRTDHQAVTDQICKGPFFAF